jgi:ceramide glucosyltransferase
MGTLSLLLLILTIFSLLYALVSASFTASFFVRRRPVRGDGAPLPPVSIVKPLAEADETDLENLRTFCDQDYPEYEIVFCLSQDERCIIPLLERLRRDFPGRAIRWVVLQGNPGPNRKVAKLAGGIEGAANGIVVLSDGDTRVGRSYLRDIVSEFLQEELGLVTCLYRGVHVRDLRSGLQALSIQTDFVPNVLFDQRIEGISYAFGATLCTTKKILASIGGFEGLQGYLADDYQLGNRIHRKGHRIRLSPYLVDHVISRDTLKGHFLQRLRWAVTYRVSRHRGYLASFITHGVSLSLALFMADGLSSRAAMLLALLCAVRILSFLYLNARVFRNREITWHSLLVPFNDLLITVFWFLSLFVRTVTWRGRRFRVFKSGRILELPSRDAG